MVKKLLIPVFILVNTKGDFLAHNPVTDDYAFVKRISQLKIWDWFDAEIATLLIKEVERKNFYCTTYQITDKERKILNVD